MDKLLMNALIKPNRCEHYEEFIVSVEQIPLSLLTSDDNYDIDAKIIIIGLKLRQCIRCGEYFVNNEIDRIKQLVKVKKDLRRLYQGQTITINLSDTNKSVPESDIKFVENSTLPEVATFQHKIPRFGLEDVILSEEINKQLANVKIKIKYGNLFYVKYNFQKVRPYGKATIILFYGPSGTGKTRTAEGLAKSLNLNFIDVNLSDLESRFVSQTSKNIRQAFVSALEQNALIFFDEADTVLGKRLTRVNQGAEAEINAARSTMLKELESFDGVCVFATNFVGNIDKAFTRRITYNIPFDLPDERVRKRLWGYFLLETLPFESSQENWLNELVDLSEGLTGADIVSAIELTFPMAMEISEENPVIRKNFLLTTIAEVKLAKAVIGENSDVEKIQSMFNLK